MEIVPGPVNGVKVALQGEGEVHWSFMVDDNLDPAFLLMHQQQGQADATVIAKGKKPAAVQVDFGVDGLVGDKLHWRIACLPFNPGTWPVWVQVFQKVGGKHVPISPIIQYELKVQQNGKSVVDFIEFK